MNQEFELAKSKAILLKVRERLILIYEGLSDCTKDKLLEKLILLESDLDSQLDILYKVGGEHYNYCLIPILHKISMYVDLAKQSIADHRMPSYLDDAISEIDFYFTESS